jgi:hypothetical protein
MNKSYIKIVLIAIFLVAVEVTFAQSAPSPQRTPPPPPGLPIDGGLLALFAVGLGYAARKLRLKK